jgi:hypothetical protein
MANNLAQHIQAYTAWRTTLGSSISKYLDWVHTQELGDAQADLRIQHLLDRLNEDKLNVAFVAEFSRGKSELINAIFFADFGQRLLPSSAGRTTMCPTELMYDEGRKPFIQLLPIETRGTDTTITEYKRYPDEWHHLDLDTSSSDGLAEAFRQVSQIKRVSTEEAKKYGLYRDDNADNAVTVHEDGTVDIPSWRHAIINFPHPLLKQGLVILDTPGLNAIGTEPELTLNLIPNAHAVLFLLAADTGVTKSDIDVWRNHIGSGKGRQKGRIAVLNKIDGMWDELKSKVEIEKEIMRQVETSAELLGLNKKQIFPISAQKAMVAKVNGDTKLLAKSRLPELEHALSSELIPSKQEIVREDIQAEIEDLTKNTTAILDARLNNVNEQLHELSGLRGKNQDVIEHMMQKIKTEKEEFEKGLQRFQALRSVFSRHTNTLFTYLGMEALKNEITETRKMIDDSKLSKGVLGSMSAFFKHIHNNINKATEQISEIHNMMQAMYQKFTEEHHLTYVTPPTLSTLKYSKRIEYLEKSFNEDFDNFWSIAKNAKSTLERKFFETLASEVKLVYEVANREIEHWLKAIMAPMESQVREHQLQLRRRLESIKRIHQATDTLEDRIAELEHVHENVSQQLGELNAIIDQITQSLAASGVETQIAAA